MVGAAEMGMYTGLRGIIVLRDDAPRRVGDLIRWMMGMNVPSEDARFGLLVDPPHHFFRRPRSAHFLRRSSSYFRGRFERHPEFDGKVLCFGISLKNYNDEIKYFLKWIAPYVERAVGMAWRYEGYGESKIEFQKGRFIMGAPTACGVEVPLIEDVVLTHPGEVIVSDPGPKRRRIIFDSEA